MSTRYQVPDISCGHCQATIEQGLRPLEGVSEVVVDVEEKTVRVDGTASDAQIRGTLDELGYPAAV